MLIDWFTVAAQLVNFAILVWLLKRFLYRPVLAAMAAREKRVRDTVAAAESQRSEAEEETRRLRDQRERFDAQKADLLGAARAEADATRNELLGQAREEAEARRKQWQESLDHDWRSFRDELARRTQDEAFSLARHALRELAGAELEERIAHAFVHQLDDLDPATRECFRADGGDGAPLVVRSGFELPEPLRDHLRQSLHQQLDSSREIVFETNPKLIAGIEVASDGHKLAWSLDDYLDSLKLDVRAFTEPQTAT